MAKHASARTKTARPTSLRANLLSALAGLLFGAMERHREILAAEGALDLLRDDGQLYLYRDEAHYAKDAAAWELRQRHGLRIEFLRGPDAIRALEPDLHFKPEVELYNLVRDPLELRNVADEEPEIVELLTKRMEAHIARREKETKRTNPMYTNLDWHGKGGGPFRSSEQAYNSLYIGSISTAQALQAKAAQKKQAGGKEQRAQAAHLDALEPGWAILYGPWSRVFFAFAAWPATRGVVVNAPTPEGLWQAMREAEMLAVEAGAWS